MSLTPPSVAINRLHAETLRLARTSRGELAAAVAAAWQAGQLLRDEKARVRKLGADVWRSWLETNFQGTAETAQRYMKLVRLLPDPSQSKHLSLRQTYVRLGISMEPKTRRQLARLPRLPPYIFYANSLTRALQGPAADRLTADQRTARRTDLRRLYELLRRLYER